MNEDLVARLQAHAVSLTSRVLEQMYSNPFWDARFGDRGRQFAKQDGEFHLAYLTQSLTAGSPQTMVNYARWLQSVLTTRGMCTLHIDENFERLSAAIAEGVEWAALACEHLEWARRALQYDPGPARDLQDASAPLLASRSDTAGTDAAEQWRYLASYLADSVALGRPDVIANHVSWLAQHNPGIGSRGAGALLDELAHMVRAVEQFPAATRDEALRVIGSARERLTEGSSPSGAAVAR